MSLTCTSGPHLVEFKARPTRDQIATCVGTNRVATLLVGATRIGPLDTLIHVYGKNEFDESCLQIICKPEMFSALLVLCDGKPRSWSILSPRASNADIWCFLCCQSEQCDPTVKEYTHYSQHQLYISTELIH